MTKGVGWDKTKFRIDRVLEEMEITSSRTVILNLDSAEPMIAIRIFMFAANIYFHCYCKQIWLLIVPQN